MLVLSIKYTVPEKLPETDYSTFFYPSSDNRLRINSKYVDIIPIIPKTVRLCMRNSNKWCLIFAEF